MTQDSIKLILGRKAIHPFPARMAPPIIAECLRGLPAGSRILDPMMGSGTVLAIARACGHSAVGVDIDPLAVLNSRVWLTTLDEDLTRVRARDVLRRASSRLKKTPARDAYPKGADAETRKFIRYWFDVSSRRQLAALAHSIGGVRDDVVREALWCGFSRLIISKQAGASRAMDLSHSRPHRTYSHAPIQPMERYLEMVEHVVKNCITTRERKKGPRAVAMKGDARVLKLSDESFDLILTSPPYLNAIDYMRCSKFSLVWMGYTTGDVRELRRTSIGAEVGTPPSERTTEAIAGLKLEGAIPERFNAILSTYISDMVLTMNESRRVVRPKGKVVYVVGESTVRGTFIPTAKIVQAAAHDAGLKLVERRSRELPNNRRYMPPPSLATGRMTSRMRSEVVLTFQHR